MDASSQTAACSECGLARFFDLAGSITPQDAVKRAELNLAFIRKDVMADIDSALETIGLLLIRCVADPSQRPYDALADAANTIHSVGGTFDLGPLGVAAFMMRSYVDVLHAKGLWDGEGLRLYLDAMKCLRGDSSGPECQAVLAGLQKLANRNLVKSQAVSGLALQTANSRN